MITTALGVGEKAVSDTSSRPDMHHDGSEYSEGQRQRALGLEEITAEQSTINGYALDPLTDTIPAIAGGDGAIDAAVDGLQFETRDAL